MLAPFPGHEIGVTFTQQDQHGQEEVKILLWQRDQKIVREMLTV